MRFLSVCSGIEAASVAWQPLGWRAVAFSEIEPFPCALLAHHYPDTPNWGDMTKFKDWPDESIDLLCGGTPCQSFSVAGLRKGMDDPRGNLMLTFGAIAAKYRPQWLVWENVPGVLSSNAGADFGAFLGMLGQLGYGFAYRILDAQYFGVAQRRRRVFVVGCLGDWRSAAAVLFERHSLQGHPAPSRQAGQEVAGTFGARSTAGGGFGGDFETTGGLVEVSPTRRAGGNRTGGDRPPGTDVDTCETLIPVPHAQISPALKARDGKGPSSDGDGDGAILVPMVAHSLRGEGFDASEDGTGRDAAPCVAYTTKLHNTTSNNAGKIFEERTVALDANSPAPSLITAMQVRRLTPTECERLQGFPDNYTAVPHRGKPAADGPRYKALGNSWAVPNVRWIGRRIDAVSQLISLEQAA